MNESDTYRILITPALQKAGWGDTVWHMADQDYFTECHIVLIGNGHKRLEGKKADYLLRYKKSFPTAVFQAKAEELGSSAVLQQVEDYAQILGLSFCYSTNSHGIEEMNFTNNNQRSLDAYPTPEDLWQRLCETSLQSALVVSACSVGASLLA